MKKNTGFIIFLVLIFSSALVSFASIRQLEGEWKNSDVNTREITKIRIRVRGVKVGVRVWGKCHPKDCDWGSVQGYPYASSIRDDLESQANALTAVFNTTSTQTMLFIKVSKRNRMTVNKFSRFKGNDQRSNYYSTDYFTKTLSTKPPELKIDFDDTQTTVLDKENRWGKKGLYIVGMGVAGDTGHTFAWYRDGTVSSGVSDRLDRHRKRYRYILPRGKTPDDIVGMGTISTRYRNKKISTVLLRKLVQITAFQFKKKKIKVYNVAWYRDGTYSVGDSNNLTLYGPKKYSLPLGKSPRDIVGMAIAKNTGHAFAWYRDGTVTSGSCMDLDKHRLPYRYVLPRGINTDDIVGMGITPDTGHTLAWYKNGMVSSGVSNHLDRYRKLYRYRLPKR